MKTTFEQIDESTVIVNGKTYRAESEAVLSDMERNVKDVKDVKYTVEYCKVNKVVIVYNAENVEQVFKIIGRDKFYKRNGFVSISKVGDTVFSDSWKLEDFDDYNVIAAAKFIEHNQPATVDSKSEILSALERLPEPYRSEAIKEYHNYKFHPFAQWNGEPKYLLDAAFNWYKTEKGYGYWNDVRNKMINGELVLSEPATVEQAEPKWCVSWEVLSVTNEIGQVLSKRESGKYSENNPNGIFDGSAIIDGAVNGKVKITRIRNKQSGEEFTVGDKVQTAQDGVLEIREIKIQGDTFTFKFDTGHIYSEYCHPVKPLFTTHDGVDVFDGDAVYSVDTDKVTFGEIIEESIANPQGGWVYFSTYKAAVEYVKLNKPCLSVQEVMRNISIALHPDDYAKIEAKLKALVKL